MSRSVIARVKTPQGEWQRFTGTTSLVAVTGFDPDVVIEWDDGTGTIREFTTVAANTDATLATGTGAASVAGFPPAVSTGSSISLIVEEDGTISLDLDVGPAELTITDAEPFASYDEGAGAGLYDRTWSGTGPVELYPGLIVRDGGSLILQHAPLVAYDFDTSEPPFVYAWQADTLGNGTFADLGAAGTSYVLTAAEAGDDVRLAWSITDDNGTISGFTNAISIDSAASWAVTGGDGSFTITSQPTKPATPTVTGGDGSFTITG